MTVADHYTTLRPFQAPLGIKSYATAKPIKPVNPPVKPALS